MDPEISDESKRLKKYLRRLSAMLHDSTLGEAADHIDKLGGMLVTVERLLLAYESRGLKPPTSEILGKFFKPRALPLQPAQEEPADAPVCDRALIPSEIQHLGDKVLSAFETLVLEAWDWNGEPCVGTSAGGASLRGSLPHLKRAGLLTTYVKPDGSERGTGTYVRFTDFGLRMAKEVEELRDPAASARKVGVHSYVGSDLAQFRSDEHVVPKGAQLAVTLEWPGNPASTPQETYWLFADANGSAWYMFITTFSAEGEPLYADGGWLEPSGGVEPKDAATRILAKIWQDEATLGEFRGSGVRVAKVGLLTEDDVRRIEQSIQR